MDPIEILAELGFPADRAPRITPFVSEEDGEKYEVWRVSLPQKEYVLKRSKGQEKEIYEKYLKDSHGAAPEIYASVSSGGNDYLLMEYIQGDTLSRMDRSKLILALDALISLQQTYWEHKEADGSAYGFEKSLDGRARRGKYLNSSLLEQAYAVYLDLYGSIPKTLCHDDLLPFNVIASSDRVAIVDWEVAGMLPYPTSLARLLAHADSSEDGLFRISEEDKEFAIEYYYNKLIKPKGIDRDTYKKTLEAFFFYEYCEWVMLEVKYGGTDPDRYKKYLALAEASAKDILKSKNIG